MELEVELLVEFEVLLFTGGGVPVELEEELDDELVWFTFVIISTVPLLQIV